MRSECHEVRLVCLCAPINYYLILWHISHHQVLAYYIFFIKKHPLLSDRDLTVRQHTKLLPYYWLRLTRGKNMNKWMSSGRLSTKARSAYLDYLHQSGKVINDCDLTIKRFNYVRLFLPQFCNSVTFSSSPLMSSLLLVLLLL